MTRLEIAVALRCAAVSAGPNLRAVGEYQEPAPDWEDRWDLDACFDEAERMLSYERGLVVADAVKAKP